MITDEAVELLSRIEKLSLQERAWLLGRLASSVEREVCDDFRAEDLEAMAADPDIQREMRAIEEDFRKLAALPPPEQSS
ncbi:MAG TPA: hypothetical protein VMS17_20450 [Gemmataceae bacterium]|nr:hypothetical protein [Gemmataceae bacterium]